MSKSFCEEQSKKSETSENTKHSEPNPVTVALDGEKDVVKVSSSTELDCQMPRVLNDLSIINTEDLENNLLQIFHGSSTPSLLETETKTKKEQDEVETSFSRIDHGETPTRITANCLTTVGEKPCQFFIVANQVNVSVSQSEAVALGNYNTLIFQTEGTTENEKKDGDSINCYVIKPTKRKPEEGELIPNGRSRRPDLDYKTDARVELAVFRDSACKKLLEYDFKTFNGKHIPEYLVSVSVVREAVNTEAKEQNTEDFYLMKQEQSRDIGTCLFLFRFFGPRAKFHVTFCLLKKLIESKYSCLDTQETKWDSLCQVTVLMENAGENKKRLKKCPKRHQTHDLVGLPDDLVTLVKVPDDDLEQVAGDASGNAICQIRSAKSASQPDVNKTGKKANYRLDGLKGLEDDTSSEEELCDVKSPGKKHSSSDKANLIKKPSLITVSGQCKTKMYHMIMGKLALLQDNGHWDDFDQISADLLQCFNWGKKDIQCVVTIERGVKAYYRNELEDSRKQFNRALELTSHTDNPLLLEGRTYFLLANVYREEKKLGMAQKCLQLSVQRLCMVESDEDTAELYYYYGSFLMECLNISTQLSRSTLLEAKNYFENELQIAVQCSDARVKRKKMQYALLKIAMLLLDCRNQLGRERKVILADVEEAKSCLDTIERELWEFVAYGTKIQFYFARSDQFYRQESYTKALELAEQALSMIQEKGYNSQISKAEGRISHLQKFIRTDFINEIPSEGFVQQLLRMTDDSHGHSASNDTDAAGWDDDSLDVLNRDYDL